jgi:hypothetical protein
LRVLLFGTRIIALSGFFIGHAVEFEVCLPMLSRRQFPGLASVSGLVPAAAASDSLAVPDKFVAFSYGQERLQPLLARCGLKVRITSAPIQESLLWMH